MSNVPAGLETLDFSFSGGQPAGAFAPVLVGVVGSGNLEVLLEAARRRRLPRACRDLGARLRRDLAGRDGRLPRAPSAGRRARLDQRHGRHARGGEPAARPGGGRDHRSAAMISYAECSARERLAQLLDAGSFHEWLPPTERVTSPHLAQLGVPCGLRRRRGHRPRHARRPHGVRRRAGGRVHGRRRRRGAWRQAGRPAAARAARSARRRAAAGRIGRRAPARGQRRPDRGVGSHARAARRARGRHPRHRADRRGQRLLRRHGHRRALRRPRRDERHGAAGDVRARGDRGLARRRGIRLARPRAGLAHDRRQAPLADRRLRRAGRGRRGRVSRGGHRGARSVEAADAGSAGGRARAARCAPARAAGDKADGDEATLLWSALGIADAQRVPDLDVDAVRALRTIN